MALSSRNRLSRTDIKEFFLRTRTPGNKSDRPFVARVVRVDMQMGRVYSRLGAGRRMRLAVVVPKTVSKKSTIRNTLKRRTTEWMRNTVSRAAARDVIIVLNKRAGVVSRQEFYKELGLAIEHIPGIR